MKKIHEKKAEINFKMFARCWSNLSEKIGYSRILGFYILNPMQPWLSKSQKKNWKKIYIANLQIFLLFFVYHKFSGSVLYYG